MPKSQWQWVRVRTLTPTEKADIASTCERFIAEWLKPRFLPEIRPTEFNYAIDMFGRWRGNRYSFITRYRSGFPDNAGDEFDAGFTRLDLVEERLDAMRFDLMWRRHTGQWFRLHSALSLEEALERIRTDGRLHPPL